MDEDELERARELEGFKLRIQSVLILQQATSAFEHAALKPPFLLNGGALIVALPFLGAVAASSDERFSIENVDLVWWAIGVWAFGLTLAAIATALGFAHQLNFYSEGTKMLAGEKDEADAFAKTATTYRKWAYGCWIFSLFSFLAGVVLGILGLAL